MSFGRSIRPTGVAVPEKYIRRNGVPVLLRHTGRTTLPESPPPSQGTSVVCLHDAGLQSSVFEDLLDALEADGISAFAFDLPGHGRSGSLDSLPSIEAMADLSSDIAAWCGIERALVLGPGRGALVAIEWARNRPDTVEALVLCGVGAAMDVSDSAIEQMRSVTRGKAPRPFDPTRVCKASGRDMMRRAYMEGIKTDPRATLVDLEASRDWASRVGAGLSGDAGSAKSDTLHCPVRIVCGSAESESARERAQSLSTAFSSPPPHVIENAAHLLPLESPAALASEISRVARQ